MNDIKIEFCERLPPGDELDGILSQFYELAVQRMRAMGLKIDPVAPQSALAEFRSNSDDYLPRRAVSSSHEKATGKSWAAG